MDEHLEQIALMVNLAVCDAQKKYESRQMGTTMAALCVKGQEIYAANIGDSRIYGFRQGRFKQISKDHTDEAYMKLQGVTKRSHRLTQYVGMDPTEIQVEPYLTQSTLKEGDIYLICRILPKNII